MDLSKLKDKLDDGTFAELSSFVESLTGQRDEARRESIEGRKGLKTKLEQAEAAIPRLLDKLGIDSLEELDTLPDGGKGGADALKQMETKLRRMERELNDAKAAKEEVSGKFRTSLQRAAIAEALGGHQFLAKDVVETYIGQRLTWEGDDLLFKSDDGKLIPVADGVSGFAKARPELLKSTGAGGSGYRSGNARGGAANQPNPWAKESFNLTEQLRLKRENPELAAQMQSTAAGKAPA